MLQLQLQHTDYDRLQTLRHCKTTRASLCRTIGLCIAGGIAIVWCWSGVLPWPTDILGPSHQVSSHPEMARRVGAHICCNIIAGHPVYPGYHGYHVTFPSPNSLKVKTATKIENFRPRAASPGQTEAELCKSNPTIRRPSAPPSPPPTQTRSC